MKFSILDIYVLSSQLGLRTFNYPFGRLRPPFDCKSIQMVCCIFIYLSGVFRVHLLLHCKLLIGWTMSSMIFWDSSGLTGQSMIFGSVFVYQFHKDVVREPGNYTTTISNNECKDVSSLAPCFVWGDLMFMPCTSVWATMHEMQLE